ALDKIPLEASRPEDFVPAGWAINSQTQGDLNGDGLKDYALDVTPKEPPDFMSYDAVVVLFAEKGGKLRRFAVNDQLSDNGFGAKQELSFDKGVLVANTNYGNSDATDVTFRFRFDRAAGKLMLIGYQIENYSRPGSHDGYVTSENYLTGVRIETVNHLDTRRNSDAIYGSSTSKRSRLKRLKVTFEEAQPHD
nr:hypothetical protein [Acidobacteriota bacterium]